VRKNQPGGNSKAGISACRSFECDDQEQQIGPHFRYKKMHLIMLIYRTWSKAGFADIRAELKDIHRRMDA
jgi:hypothetical protein